MKSGISARQGGHHVAQKFKTTIFPSYLDDETLFPSNPTSSHVGAFLPIWVWTSDAFDDLRQRHKDNPTRLIQKISFQRWFDCFIYQCPTVLIMPTTLHPIMELDSNQLIIIDSSGMRWVFLDEIQSQRVINPRFHQHHTGHVDRIVSIRVAC